MDTAGRLHNKKNLMDEMEKIRRVIDREYPEATVRCLLVVDATTGQNGLQQARAFREAAGINGIVLTKLDGTAKGGIAFGIVRELKTRPSCTWAWARESKICRPSTQKNSWTRSLTEPRRRKTFHDEYVL